MTIVPGPAAVVPCARAAPCRRVDALVGELEGGDITAGDRAHIAGDLLATCPAIPDREKVFSSGRQAGCSSVRPAAVAHAA